MRCPSTISNQIGCDGNLWSTPVHTVAATAVVRSWPLLLFFAGWAAAICLICHYVHDVAIQSTLLTVIGTVLGFIISYRTTSSFERYNEGRRLWSQVVLASRNFSRTVWFHVPEPVSTSSSPLAPPNATKDEGGRTTRALIEKKAAINLIEAFAVAVKHYLRGEDGIHYADLYHLVKFLPSYALPSNIPSRVDLADAATDSDDDASGIAEEVLPEPAMAKPSSSSTRRGSCDKQRYEREAGEECEEGRREGVKKEPELLPAYNLPRFHIMNIWPLSAFVRVLMKRGKDAKVGRTPARLRARHNRKTASHNVPLEISFYLSSYVAALQSCKAIDVPTTNALMSSLNQLVEALTGFERILTTPIPLSYRVHLWLVTVLYCLSLPFQIWKTIGWLTIPATTLLSAIYFGFLVAGGEIENPFGYDKNDLNMDHFTHNIIRRELRALTAQPVPVPSDWAFSRWNDLLVVQGSRVAESPHVAPEERVRRGVGSLRDALAEAV